MPEVDVVTQNIDVSQVSDYRTNKYNMKHKAGRSLFVVN